MKKVYIFILAFVLVVLTGVFMAKINISKKETVVAKAKEEKEIIDVQYRQNSSWVEGEIKSRNPLNIEKKVSSTIDMTKNGNIYLTRIKLYYTDPLVILKDHEGFLHYFTSSKYTKIKG